MQTTIKIRRLAAGLLMSALAAQAAPLTPAELPPAVRDWLPWAQQGQPPLGCPTGAAENEAPVCVWPGRLQLAAGTRDATFRLDVQVFGAPARVALPGEAGAWPQDVKAGGKPLPVTEADGPPGRVARARHARRRRAASPGRRCRRTWPCPRAWAPSS